MTSFWPFSLCLCVVRSARQGQPACGGNGCLSAVTRGSRTSSLTAQGRVALQELQQATSSRSGLVGLVELFAGVGGFRRAMEHCGVVPALHVTV